MKNFTVLVLLLTYTLSSAQLRITSTNTNYSIDFDQSVSGINNGTFDGSGFSSTPEVGQINSNGIIIKGLSDSDMNFGDTPSSGDFARGSSKGSKTTGGVYSFEIAANDFGLGIQPGTSDFTPGEIILKVQNNTGRILDEIIVSYDIYVLNNAGRSSSWNFSYSKDNNSYINVAALDFATPLDSDVNPSWINTTKNNSISENITDGGSLYLKWISDDISGSGSRDEIALDNIIINAKSSTDTPTSISKNFDSPAILYPNPFNSYLSIKSDKGIKSVEIINTIGTTILTYEENSQPNITLHTEKISEGIYIVKVIETNGYTTTKKLIKRSK